MQERPADDATGTGRAGPVFDRAMRRLVAADLPGFCRVLGVDVEPVDGAVPVLASRFPSGDLDADLLVRVGPGRLLHVEYQRRGEAGLARRMLRYRGAVMDAYPQDDLEQVVVVLGDGLVDSVDSPVDGGFRLGCRAVYLRDVAPELLLATPASAPLAVLGRGTPDERAVALGRALRTIRDGGGDRTVELLDAAAVLATIRLHPVTIEKIRREAGMTVESIADFYEQTDFGRLIQDRAREQGIEQGIEQALTVALVERFGIRPETAGVAHRLAAGTDLATAMHTVMTAQAFEDLLPDA
ncbi:hypothetical protein [Kineosporia sp. A_224]|uniref:hypothetical protein n=1 Tax=Kineosporia sp. A_224 TaxID=1962180 RepID=UPI000B4A689F|nr:hypothetical protein [Kineosporia sp. A_224]